MDTDGSLTIQDASYLNLSLKQNCFMHSDPFHKLKIVIWVKEVRSKKIR